MPLLPPFHFNCITPLSSLTGLRVKKRKANQSKMREKKRSSTRKNRQKSAQLENNMNSDAIRDNVCNIDNGGSRTIAVKDHKVPGFCICYSLRRVFGSKRRYRHHPSEFEDTGYESSVSKSSTPSMPRSSSTITTDSSFNDSPKPLSPKSPLKVCGANDKIGFGSVKPKANVLRSNMITSSTNNSLFDSQNVDPFSDTDSISLVYKTSCIPTSDSASELEIKLSLSELLTKGKKLRNPTPDSSSEQEVTLSLAELLTKENNEDNSSTGDNVEGTGTRCSGCFSLPDDAETAFIERQLDEMSNQSSILSFDPDDFMEDDTDDVNYAVHVDNYLDLTPIHEEIGEDFESTC